jgi:hypothetical protein
MFSSQNAVSWFFDLCFAASTAWFALLLDRMRREINSVLLQRQKPTVNRPIRGFWRTNIISFSLDLLDQHHQYYPASSVPKRLGLAVVAALVSVTALMLITR